MKKKGFTLIELLVVISIIALLLSILMPSLKKAKILAKIVVCGSNQHSTGLALSLYANDFNSNIPAWQCKVNGRMQDGASMSNFVVWPGWGLEPRGPALLCSSPENAYNFTGTYLANSNALFCPLDRIYTPLRGDYLGGDAYDPKWARRPTQASNPNAYPDSISYMYCYIPGDGHRWDNLKNPELAKYARYNTSIASGSSAILMDIGGWNDQEMENPDRAFAHPDGWNVLYIDGHVKSIKKDKVFPATDWLDFLKALDNN